MIIFVVIESLIAVSAVGTVLRVVRAYRTGIIVGDHNRWIAAEEALHTVLPHHVVALAIGEARVWLALMRCFTRRDGRSREFTYGASIRPVVVAMSGLVVVEGVIAEAVLLAVFGHRWWLWLVAAVHIYAVVWLLGVVASFTTLPHRVGPDAILLSDSIFGEHTIGLELISRVDRRRTRNIGRSGMAIDHDARGRLCYGDGSVILELDEVTHIRGMPVRELAISVDHPADFVADIHAAIGPAGVD
ncbi:hypothetical protein [Williamsia sterculiae]|uniref:hypothetical protein n=1 Tax=Williamsia sterculiae TaxID=1344003 RepID=UPI00117FB410|nr:hypothetical protein [Williamsia sterculiae]